MTITELGERLKEIRNSLEPKKIIKEVDNQLKGFKCPKHKTVIKYILEYNGGTVSVISEDTCCEKGKKALYEKAAEIVTGMISL